MWQKTVFLLIALKVALISAQATLSCSYAQVTPQLPYTCRLIINNPNGVDDFVAIPGQHLPNRGNNDVTSVTATFQNTRNIPSVICRQFPNIRDLYMTNNGIQNISESSFAGCVNVVQISLVMNDIGSIPDDTFRNNPQLLSLILARNSIQTIGANSFTGSSINFLDLSFNRINTLAQGTFTSIAQTLNTLFLLTNELTALPDGIFAGLTRLESLHLSGNNFGTLTSNTFAGLQNLILLHIIDAGLSEPNPELFADLSSLAEIHLESNGILALPNDLFAQSRRLTNVFLAGNNLTEITPAPFGNNLPALEVLNVIGNAIRGIDPEFFEIAENLHGLHLSGNECSNDNMEFSFEDRSSIRERLQRCFLGFGPEFISCNYETTDLGAYACHMTIRNPIGNEFTSIDGDHVGAQGNDDVTVVDIIAGNTRNIPQIICQQFPQLTAMLIINSNLETINTQSFSNCGNLEALHMGSNRIMIVPDNTFSGTPRLAELYFGTNLIEIIGPNAFAGTVLNFLDLSDNFLRNIDGVWLRPLTSTLRTLDLVGSRITNVESNAFDGLTELFGLFMGSNVLVDLHDDVFAPLVNLRELSMASASLTALNPQWFRTLTNLHRLYIARNEITSFPENIFNALTSLQEIFFYENRVVELRAESFGASLPTIRLLYGNNNLINSFDDEILDGAGELNTLLLDNNLCANFNMHDVRGDMELARQRLENCTANYRTQPEVSCVYDRMIIGRIYWCRLTAINPVGLDPINTITGDHLPDGNDDDVVYVQVEDQNTRVVPAALCRQFQNMEILDLFNSNIYELTPEVFQNCGFLHELYIMRNNIRSIPARTFAGAPNLQNLVLASNGISEISPFAFAGTRLRDLDLTHNRISVYDPMVYGQVGNTLTTLRLTDNMIESLPQFAFGSIPIIEDFELNGNLLTRIPHNAFFRSSNLRILQIANNRLERLEVDMFSRCESLVDLELGVNVIEFLPENIFDLPTLRTLGIVQNNIRTLDALSFGRSLNSLLTIDASLNRITSFDPQIVGPNSSIIDFDLAFNQCVDAFFTNIPDFRDDVLQALEACIANYNNVTIGCTFMKYGETVYACDLSIDNANGRLRFERIPGDHLEDYNDNSVRSIRAIDQNSREIPRIICDTFRFAESIIFAESNVEAIQFESFENCELLFSLNLAGNNLIDIPDGLFRNNPYLNVLILATNQIEALTPGVFFGTQIGTIDLENNRLRSFNQEWFLDIQQTLRQLFLQHNQIDRLPRNAFASLAQLTLLEISGNGPTFIPSNAFRGLAHLYILHLANCGIRNLNHRWFDDARALRFLELDTNEITQLPDRIFDLTSLEYLGLAFNSLTVLDTRPYGRHLRDMIHIDAEFNQINAIDRHFIVNATSLANLQLIGNVCTNLNFLDVQENLEVVFHELEGCFNNFGVV